MLLLFSHVCVSDVQIDKALQAKLGDLVQIPHISKKLEELRKEVAELVCVRECVRALVSLSSCPRVLVSVVCFVVLLCCCVVVLCLFDLMFELDG